VNADFLLVFWLLTLGVGAAVGLLLTRLARGAAARVGLLDAPDGRRKLQSHPVPVVGGPAVFAAALTALGVAAAVLPEVAAALTADGRRSAALLVACVVIVLLGLVDDRYNLKPQYKLLGQLVAIVILVGYGGMVVDRIGMLNCMFEFGPLAVPATVLGLLFCVNALNLIDGMDGLLGTIGLTALLCLGVLAGLAGHVFPAVVALSLAGALVGFLWFNLPPASVYIGDSGSMLVGLVIGAVAIPAALKGPATVALAAPIALLVLPMTDTTAAVIRRKLTGRGLAAGDRGHIHHVLQRRGLTTRAALTVVALLCGVAAAGAFASTLLRNDLYALFAGAGVVGTLFASRLFGETEFRLIVVRVRSATRNLLHRAPNHELVIRLQGTADWEQLWRALTAYAGRHHVQSLWLDVNAPLLSEDYHARWERTGGRPAGADLWRLELPLRSRGHAIGRLLVSGWYDTESVLDKFAALAQIIERAELGVAQAVEPARPAPAARTEPARVEESLVLSGSLGPVPPGV
jgi:UDP-GlcNAc:undecaprenyl-phosphate GlcNAc-1-phosphate transferase